MGSHPEVSKPTNLQIWGWAFLFVTIICLCSMVGAIFISTMKKKYFKRMLQFMIGLATGSLSGSAVFHLIPQAFNIYEDKFYINKAAVIIGGIYLFFITEWLIKIFLEHKRAKYFETKNFKFFHPYINTLYNKKKNFLNIFSCCHATSQHSINNIPVKSEKITSDIEDEIKTIKDSTIRPRSISFNMPNQYDKSLSPGDNNRLGSCLDPNTILLPNECSTVIDILPNELIRTCSHENGLHVQGQKTIVTLAYMILLGDGLHNFIDGLSIGAAFARNFISGVSISLAVIFEEFPHELGDFAILINSGMSIKKAMLCNFISASTCYIGMIIGIFMGEDVQISFYIFSLAAGMFLYISLVDMMPELNKAIEKANKLGDLTNTLIALFLGLIIGLSSMSLLAKHASMLEF